MSFVHYELSTSDPNGAGKFYKSVLGWKTSKAPMPGVDYTMVADAAGKMFGGIQQHPMPGAPPMWLGYAIVKSVSRTLAKVQKAGGTVSLPLTEVPGQGKLAICLDPQGAPFGIWEAAAPPAAKKKSKKKAKKVAKKKSAAKKASSKTAKKASRRPAKKTAKKKTAKRPAKKKTAKKKTAKRPAKKKTAKKKSKR